MNQDIFDMISVIAEFKQKCPKEFLMWINKNITYYEIDQYGNGELRWK